LIFNHDSIICIDFTSIAASNTTNDDVANKVTHSKINTD